MAGGALRWYKDTFMAAEADQTRLSGLDVYDLITARAETISPGSEGLFFQPYLAGERTPHRSASARSSFIGATIRHTKNHFSRAVLEGITFGMRDSLEIIKSLRIEIGDIRLTGGGAKSKFWRQLQADIYGHEVSVVDTTEGPAFGAALLAGVGTNLFDSVQEAVKRNVRVIERIQPNIRAVDEYTEYYRIYTGFLPNLQHTYDKIHKTFNDQPIKNPQER